MFVLLRCVQDLMEDPVLAADGFSYERAAIQDWFTKGHRSSPKTGPLSLPPSPPPLYLALAPSRLLHLPSRPLFLCRACSVRAVSSLFVAVIVAAVAQRVVKLVIVIEKRLRRGPNGAHGAATESSAPQLDPACDWQKKV